MPRFARPLAVVTLFVALTVLLVYPLSVNPGTYLVAGADTDLFMWTLGWNTHALFTRPLELFHANIYYPQPYTLAYSENLLGSTPFAAPVLWLTGNPVLALNTVALSSVVLCGVGAYVLARRLGAGRDTAILCGVIFAFAPSRFYRYGQIHLTTVQWIPFTLAYLHTYLSGGRARDLWIATGFFTWQVLATGHGAVFVTLASVVMVICHVVFGPGRRPMRGAVRDFSWPGLVLILPSILLFVPYLIVQREMGLRRSLENWAPTPQSFLASPAHVAHRLNSWLAGIDVNADASAFMFPGYVPIVLALVAIGAGWRRFGRVMLPYAAITLLAVLLSAGPPLGLWPLVYWLPGFNFVRVPSRFAILATLGIAVLAALGFELLVRKWSAPRRHLAASAVVAVMVFEFATIPFTGTRHEPDVQPIDRWLATRSGRFAIAEIPVGAADVWHSRYMLHSMAHWQATVHGHSGIRPALHDELYGQLREFPDEEGIRGLRRIGVDYLVVHTEKYGPGEWPAVERRLEAFREWLVLDRVEGSGRVYRVMQRPAGVSPRGGAVP